MYLREVDRTILQDMRYATANNFTGRRVAGYEAAECILLRNVAEALARAQAELWKSELSLKVYDCYRPRRAVQAFVEWAKMPGRTGESASYYPRLAKKDLLAGGYIAAPSSHSRGIAVDLTIVPMPEPKAPPFDTRARYGPCTGPAEARTPDNGLDMGTGFDCFDVLSHTSSPGIHEKQLKARLILVDLMAKHGFENFLREWWHFTFQDATAHQSFDVPVLAPSRRPPRLTP